MAEHNNCKNELTIAEAAEAWEVKETTVFSYMAKGYIYGLSIKNNTVMLPNIPKPYIKKKATTIKAIDRQILDSINRGMYINPAIMGIPQEQFEERLKALINVNKIFIKKDPPDYSANLDFGLSPDENTPVNISVFSDSSLISTVDISPQIEMKIADQVGLVNGKIEVSNEAVGLLKGKKQ